MEFLSVGFVLFFVIFYGIYCTLSKDTPYYKRVCLIALFNIFFYSNPGALLYLVAWSALLYISAKFKGSFKFTVLFAILQLLYWKSIEAHFIDYHPILTPLGLSFFTFQGLSYLFAVNGVSKREDQIKPWSFFEVFAFTGFFPTIVAGPILRATKWKEELSTFKPMTNQKYSLAMGSIAAGCFYKICLANYLYEYVSIAYADPLNTSSALVLAGVLAYSFEIFFDFAGYSLIALGVLKLLGLEFEKNFNSPYLSRNLKEFWTKWHMSLSSWLKDYFYIAFLGGNKAGKLMQTRNAVVVMLVCGAWHGLAGNYLVWGLLHAAAIGFLNLTKPNQSSSKISHAISALITFTYVTLAWVFFRAQSIDQAFEVLQSISNVDSWASLDWDIDLIIKSIFLFVCALIVYLEPKVANFFKIITNSASINNLFVQTVWWSLVFVTILVISPAGMPPFIYAQF